MAYLLISYEHFFIIIIYIELYRTNTASCNAYARIGIRVVQRAINIIAHATRVKCFLVFKISYVIVCTSIYTRVYIYFIYTHSNRY